MSAAICGAEVLFQSTLSMRRATETCCRAVTMLCISIHALHEESDTHTKQRHCKSRLFQSTLSMRRATQGFGGFVKSATFQSTLSMRRATATPLHCFLDEFAFQSTLSMRRATSWTLDLAYGSGEFQSTLSMRRATILDWLNVDRLEISIHALHEESDPRSRRATTYWTFDFNPRSP